MKAFVTGADGFIGSHLVELLIDRGYEVKAFCFYNSSGSWGWLDQISKEKSSNLEVVLGDIRDHLTVRESMKGCEIVFHLAALIAIPYSYVAPDSYIDTNIKGTLNVVQAARDLNISRVVHTSTSETYGSAQFVPISESHPLVAQSPYAASKIGADQIALSFWKSFSLPVTVLRPFNTYGPRQSNRAVIPQIITQIANKKKIIQLGDIRPTRDFNYVIDTCLAFIAVANSTKTIGEVINSSSNFEISIGQTVKLISELMNSPVEIKSDEKRIRPANSEVTRLIGDNKKIFRLTDWKPKYQGIDGLKMGLDISIKWFTDKNNLALYKTEYVI